MLPDLPIIRTRITLPRRRGDIFARPRLIHLLNEALEKRLLLVSAPAGYGKTSLLVDFASTCPLPVCWYAIDALDHEPQRFFAYFTASIQQQFPAFGQRTAAMLASDQAQINGEEFAAILINDLYEHVSEHFLMILDDYHLVNENREVRAFLDRLLQDMEENCHLLISSRSLLPMPSLPVLAARSEVSGISFEELAFSPHEIQLLYQQSRRHNLSLVEAEEVYERTEGWITGILLASQVNKADHSALLRLSRASGFNLDEYYLQIINRLSSDLRSFLLWSSILEEFNADHCRKVIEPAIGITAAPWQSWMDAIQQDNLFVLPVGEEGDWLRYHPLFLDFLQNRVHREIPDIANAIENQLAETCIQNNEWDRAFSIYRRLDSHEKLVALIERAGPDLVTSSRISTLSAWLDSLPADVLNTRPYIVALQGYVAMSLGDTSLALSLFRQAVDAMQLPADREYLARTLSMRATLLRLMGHIDAAIADANESMLLAGSSLTLRKIKGHALRCIGLCKYHQGKLADALTWLENSLHIMRAIGDQKNEAIIRMEIGLAHENLGNYSQAKIEYHASLDYWQKIENPIWLSNLLNNLGVLQQLLGEYQQAIQSLEKALDYARASGYARMEAFILTGIGDIYTELQADSQAEEAYQNALSIAEKAQEHFLVVYINIQLAALCAYRDRLEQGYRFIEQARALIELKGTELERRMCDLEFAGLKIMEGKANEILIPLEEACSFFETEGHKIPYEKTHLYLTIAYQALSRPEKVIENLLHLISSMQAENAPTHLYASAARKFSRLKSCKVDYMQAEFNKFLQRVREFEEDLPVMWRYLREQSRAVPFAPATLRIRALGRMQIEINNHIVTSSDWQTQAARDLFFMLMAHSEGMTKEEISLILWPDASAEEAKFRFKNTVYRLRRALGKNSVLLENEIYRFNYRLDYEYDVELFMRENAQANQIKDPIQKLSHLREAIKYYRGDYLAEINETWVLGPRECMRQNFLNTLMEISQIYFDISNYDLALEYCQRALDEDSLLEDAHRQALRIFAAMGNRAALVRQYQRCVDILDKEIQAPPSAQTRALYEELLKL